MKPQSAGLSMDGTTEYLSRLRNHPRVHVTSRELWDGKTAMCNACLDGVNTPCVVMQIDSDEIWTTEQIEAIATIFEAHPIDRMQFWCRYYVGLNIVVGPKDGRTYGCRQNEWMRAWRMTHSGQRFLTHEPPVFAGCTGQMMGRDESAGYGLEFDHFAYATHAQVEYKERIYGYAGAVAGWERLQANRIWPTPLRPFMPWVGANATADLLIK